MMKTKLLAFLLCLVLLGAACLMTACGGNGGTTVTTAPQANGEKPAAYPELASFLKGLDAIRKGGVTVTASVKVPLEDVDYSMNANYVNGKFRSLTEDKALDEGEFHRYEVVFDGTGLYWMNEYGDETETDDDFDGVEVMDLLNETVGEKITMILSTLSSPTYLILNHKVDYLNGVNLLLDSIDYDKVAAWIGPAVKWSDLPEIEGSTYTLTLSSDAFFDALKERATPAKEISEKTVASLVDDVIGAGTFARIKTVLDKYSGTDKLSDLLAELESSLAAEGGNPDDVFDLVAEYIPGQFTGAQIKAYLTGSLAEWTIDDALAYAYGMLMSNENGMLAQDEFGSKYGDEKEESEKAAPAFTYDSIVGMIDTYAAMTVNDIVTALTGENAAERIDAAIEFLDVCKKAIRFQVSVTCDAHFVPTKITRSFKFYADEIPEKYFDEFYENYRKAWDEYAQWQEALRPLITEYGSERLALLYAEYGLVGFDYEAYATARQKYRDYREWEETVRVLKEMKDSADPSDPSPSISAEMTVEVQPSATVVPSDTMKERIAEGVQGKKITAEMTAPETGVAPAEPAPTPETTPAATTRPADATALPEDGWGEIRFFD